jgi:hypothetical protein
VMDDLEQVVARWYSDRPMLDIRQPYTAHLNDLLAGLWRPDAALEQALQAFSELARMSTPIAETTTAGLVIPLHFSTGERFGTEIEPAPAVESLKSQLALEEPPYVYLSPRDTSKYLWRFDGYRETMTGLITWSSGGVVYSRYEVSRGETAIINNWREYQRSIICEYYPESLLFAPAQPRELGQT